MKYLSDKVQVTFLEVPDEIALCISFTNCPFTCKGCHSPELREDIGDELTDDKLKELIKENKGITCVCLMGGDKVPSEINHYAEVIQDMGLLVCWYSGQPYISKDIKVCNFNYIKIGPYDESKGGLDNPNTNQIFYKVISCWTELGLIANHLLDITHKFRKNNETS